METVLVPTLWFNNKAKEAADFYVSVFKDGRIIHTDYYTEVGEDITRHKKGDVLTVEFEIRKTRFIAINGGPEFTFNPSVSFLIECETQEEIDHYWGKLSHVPEAEQCGWLQDKFGLSWQVVPTRLHELLSTGTAEQRKRVTERFMGMKKFDLNQLEEAYRA